MHIFYFSEAAQPLKLCSLQQFLFHLSLLPSNPFQSKSKWVSSWFLIRKLFLGKKVYKWCWCYYVGKCVRESHPAILTSYLMLQNQGYITTYMWEPQIPFCLGSFQKYDLFFKEVHIDHFPLSPQQIWVIFEVGPSPKGSNSLLLNTYTWDLQLESLCK